MPFRGIIKYDVDAKCFLLPISFRHRILHALFQHALPLLGELGDTSSVGKAHDVRWIPIVRKRRHALRSLRRRGDESDLRERFWRTGREGIEFLPGEMERIGLMGVGIEIEEECFRVFAIDVDVKRICSQCISDVVSSRSGDEADRKRGRIYR